MPLWAAMVRPMKSRRALSLHASVYAVLWLGVIAATSPLNAQTGHAGSQAWYLGAYGGPMFDAATSFSESCPSETTFFVGGRLGYRLMRFLSVEGAFSVHQEDHDLCTIGLLPPPPENGERTIRRLGERVRGYPYATPEGRLVVHTPEYRRSVWGRLTAGGGWMPSKDIGVLLAGLGIGFGGARIAGEVDVERWWFDVPFTDVVETYADGELESTTQLPGEFSENPVVLRFGVKWIP